MTQSDTAFIFQAQSLLIVVLMVIGIYFRRKRDLHVKIMGFTILWDIILILQIELNRGAIVKASKALENIMMLNIHVSIAVLTVLFYGAMIYTGRKLLKGQNSIRPKHKILGLATLTLRVLTLVTSYFIVV